MNRKLLQFLMVLLCAASAGAQELGKVIIRNVNPSYPGFIVSLNGVRLTTTYASSAEFSYLEERNYRVRILQAGSSNALSFMVNSAPQYVSKYLLNRDHAGNYSLILESKSLLTGEAEVNTATLAPGPASTLNTSPGAVTAMNDTEYNEMLRTVKKEGLEGTRLEMARTFFGNQNLSSAQVQGIMKAFSLENTRLNFAKFAYARTIDKQNYYKVYDAFNLSGSKKEISEYIKNNP